MIDILIRFFENLEYVLKIKFFKKCNSLFVKDKKVFY